MSEKNIMMYWTTKIKRVVVAVISLAIFSFSASAQGSSWAESIKAELQEMFSPLDKSKVPTGYLLDYAVNLVDFDAYNGQQLADSNYVNLRVFADMLSSLNSARVSSSADSLDVNNIIYNLAAGSDSVKLGVLLSDYNYIVENALTDHLITYSNERFYDVYENGVWKNPYGTSVLFGFTTGSIGTVGPNVDYVLPPSLMIGNISSGSLFFDAGDGQGYRNIQLGSLVHIYYSSDGIKELRMRVSFPNGTILESHTKVLVKNLDAQPTSLPSSYGQEDFSIMWNGTEYCARVTYITSPLHSGIEKPFIFSEGFDPWKVLRLFDDEILDTGWNSIEDFCSLSSSDYGKRSLYYNIICPDYDLIYIDWVDYDANIWANGALLKEILNWVNNQKSINGSSERNVLMGESMGGLIACYALRDMEINGISHEVDYFISNDVPYLGATVPVGLQYLFYQLKEIYFDQLQVFGDLLPAEVRGEVISFLEPLWDLPYAQSVNQLLSPIVKWSGTGYDYSYNGHLSIENYLRTNGLPKGDPNYPIENVALSDGGYFDTDHGRSSHLYDPGEKLLYLNATAKATSLANFLLPFIRHSVLRSIDLPISLGWGRNSIKAYIEVSPYTSYSQLLASYYVTYVKKVLGISKTTTLYSGTFYAPASGIIFDSVPGSYYYINASEVEEFLDAARIKNDFLSIDIGFDMKERFMFVSTASSLFSSNYLRDYYNFPPTPLTETPFQSIAVSDTSRSHTDIDNFRYYSFLENVLLTQITGSDYAVSGRYYTTSGYNDDVPLAWSTSDSEIATISSNGVISVQDTCGIINVILQGSANGKTYYKKKQVLAGLPDQVLSFSALSGIYTVNTQSVFASQEEMLQIAISNGDILYKWGVKYDDDPVVWETPSTSSSYTVQPSTGTTLTNVYLRLVDVYGNEGDVVYVTVQKPDPILVNIKRVGVFQGQNNYAYHFNFSDISNYSSGKVRLVVKKNPASGENYIPSYYNLGFSLRPRVETIQSTITYQGVDYYTFRFESSLYVMSDISLLAGRLDPLDFSSTGYLRLTFYTADDEKIHTVLIPVSYDAVFINQ